MKRKWLYSSMVILGCLGSNVASASVSLAATTQTGPSIRQLTTTSTGTVTVADWDTTTSGDTVTITGYHGSAKDVVIPVSGDLSCTNVKITKAALRQAAATADSQGGTLANSSNDTSGKGLIADNSGDGDPSDTLVDYSGTFENLTKITKIDLSKLNIVAANGARGKDVQGKDGVAGQKGEDATGGDGGDGESITLADAFKGDIGLTEVNLDGLVGQAGSGGGGGKGQGGKGGGYIGTSMGYPGGNGTGGDGGGAGSFTSTFMFANCFHLKRLLLKSFIGEKGGGGDGGIGHGGTGGNGGPNMGGIGGNGYGGSGRGGYYDGCAWGGNGGVAALGGNAGNGYGGKGFAGDGCYGYGGAGGDTTGYSTAGIGNAGGNGGNGCGGNSYSSGSKGGVGQGGTGGSGSYGSGSGGNGGQGIGGSGSVGNGSKGTKGTKGKWAEGGGGGYGSGGPAQPLSTSTLKDLYAKYNGATDKSNMYPVLAVTDKDTVDVKAAYSFIDQAVLRDESTGALKTDTTNLTITAKNKATNASVALADVTKKAGVYTITYSYNGVSIDMELTVQSKESIQLKDLTLLVGDTWKATDNIQAATDENGDPLDFSKIKITNDDKVDMTKPGSYEVTYSYGSVTEKAKVNVIDITVNKLNTLGVNDSWTAYSGLKSVTGTDEIAHTDVAYFTANVQVSACIKGTMTSVDPATLTATAGTYTVTYTFKGKSKSVDITVEVKEFVNSIQIPDTLDFGQIAIQYKKDQKITAKDPDQTNTTGKFHVKDTRSADGNGFRLKVKQDHALKGKQTGKEMANTSLAFKTGAITNTANKPIVGGNQQIKLIPGQEQSVISAVNGQSRGETDCELEDFQLTIPGTEKKAKDTYEAHLTWTLSDAP